ncbi:tyrosine-type recombinase/integrase [Shinella sp.]|uniref:tyrosine-type recombinase/integrase n=1 Tax=Shinella sp. TaxID=1870904 RepID=UPI00260E7C39|nr:tyrosine-type recombinase/integrase [Shinella sp.]MCO5148511.1 tyrosine-type recombinase/integrase [Shinella sp.]
MRKAQTRLLRKSFVTATRRTCAATGPETEEGGGQSNGERLISTRPADVRRMLEVAPLTYPSPRVPLQPLSMYTMLLLPIAAGFARGELARLDLGDVDLRDGTVTVRQTKFFKTRILPLPEQRCSRLRAPYRHARRRANGSQDARSGCSGAERGGHRRK